MGTCKLCTDRFGSAEVFEFQTIPKPVPKRPSSGESIRDIDQSH